MTTKENYSWLKKIDRSLYELDEIPLMRTSTSFNFDEFATLFSEKFNVADFKIETSNTLWRSYEESVSSLGDNLISLSFTLSPLEGVIYWIMPKEDVSKFTSLMLTASDQQKSFASQILQEGFYRYIMLETLSFLSDMQTFQDLSPKMVENVKPLSSDALCIDIKITIQETSFWGRLAITPTFRKSWESYFINNQPMYEKEINESLELTLNATAGHLSLNFEDWKRVNIGDFIILDKAYFNPKTKKGHFIINIKNKPLFIAKLHQDKLKLTDYALYPEEEIIMENKETEENMINEENIEAAPQESTLASIEEMPINITVEIARFKMSLDKLKKLQPGNILDLPVLPEQGVNLCVNNQKIARAELVNLGDALGVRILEIG